MNRERVLAELHGVVATLKRGGFDIERLYLFGSFASGVPTPKSDVDLLVVSEKVDLQALLSLFLSVSVPVDLHVMSPGVFDTRSRSGKGIAAAALRNGLRLM